MNAPKRWKDPGSDAAPDIRSVLAYAGRRAPDAAYVATLTGAVLAQLAAPGPTLAASSAVKASAAMTSGKLLGLTLAAVLAGAGGAALHFAHQDAPKTNRTSPTPAAVDQRPILLPVPERVTPSEGSALDAQPAPLSLERPKSSEPAGRSRGARSLAKTGGSEFELLQAARLVRRTSAPRAIALLREHERRFPDSHLREEREVLMIELLSHLEPNAAAPRVADFLVRFPNSAYRERIMGMRRTAQPSKIAE